MEVCLVDWATVSLTLWSFVPTFFYHLRHEEGTLKLHIRWDGVITIQDTEHSGSIVMDADDLLDLLVDSRCGMRSLIDGHLNNQFGRCNVGGVDTSFNLTFCLHKHGNTMLLCGDLPNSVRINQESWRKLCELEVSIRATMHLTRCITFIRTVYSHLKQILPCHVI